MPTLSTNSRTRSSAIQVSVIAGFFLLLCGLLLYLATLSIPAGDGVVYLDQVLAGNLRERTLHLGYLFQLAPLAAMLGDAGATLLSALWALVAWIAAWWGATALVESTDARHRRLLALAAPAFLATLIPLWEHALFPEVYGPTAAALLGAAALRLHGKPVISALAAGLAVTMHPGALAWLPTLALMGPRPGRYGVAVLAFPAVLAAALHGDYLMGGRGVFAALDWPEPWRASQRAWRALVWGASLTAVLPAAALFRADVRRRFGYPLAVGVVLAILTDWYHDVPAQLPALYLLALAAPAGLELLAGTSVPRRRAVIGLAAVVLAFQLGEATSHQDRERRAVDREVRALRSMAGQDAPLPWGSFGERARYDHYVSGAAGPGHVALPLGEPFPARACPTQTAILAGNLQAFVCPETPTDR